MVKTEKKLNIAIVTYFFPPVISPRAFRANEFVESFLNAGHKVTVYYAKLDKSDTETKNGKLYKIPVSPKVLINNDTIENYYYKGKKRNTDNTKKKTGTLKKIFKSVYLFLFGPAKNEFAINLTKELLKQEKIYDILISVALPFGVHYGVARAMKNKQIAKVAFADYGDPYYTNIRYRNKFGIHQKFIEKRALKRFDYIIIPFESADKYYTYLKEKDKIILIPHFVDAKKFSIADYTPNKSKKFAFAGTFYPDINNPSAFLRYLSQLEENFEFHFYTDTNIPYIGYLLSEFKDVLSGKLFIHPLLPRDEIIYELSKYDFLVLFATNIGHTKPSKLIDYTLTQRPILNVNTSKESFNEFDDFLSGDYTGAIKADLKKYDPKDAVNKIISISRESLEEDIDF